LRAGGAVDLLLKLVAMRHELVDPAAMLHWDSLFSMSYHNSREAVVSRELYIADLPTNL
jgi:hypothetical protein